MDKAKLEKIGKTDEEKLLLAKLYDKVTGGIRKNIPASTGFLSPHEQSLARYLFGDAQGLHFFGGYGDAERKMLCYLPEYLTDDWLLGDDGPVVCIRGDFFPEDKPDHRDFLGALMGAGIAREAVGDICVGDGFCNFFVTKEIAPFVLQELKSAGRTRLHLTAVPLAGLILPEQKTVPVHDTVASLRLDALVSSGFRISRSLAAEYITGGRAMLNGIPCEKPDRDVRAGDKISVRGLGKILLESVGGQSKKGRYIITIQKYV